MGPQNKLREDPLTLSLNDSSPSLIPADFCCGVQQVMRGPESITALMFHPKSGGLPLLVVGTDRGTVILVKTDDLSTTSLDQRYL